MREKTRPRAFRDKIREFASERARMSKRVRARSVMSHIRHKLTDVSRKTKLKEFEMNPGLIKGTINVPFTSLDPFEKERASKVRERRAFR